MVATRSLQLTVKKTTRSQKTLEGQLLMIKDGERTAISSRVAELDQILPQYLGVSKAILENVIFCHQDDSLWPMSEPSVLKKKFDEIFEALKYTKAIENIKILRKKQNEELGKLKLIEQHAKQDKDRGDRTEKKSQELFDEIEEMREQVKEIEKKEEEASEKCTEAFGNASRFEQLVARLQTKRVDYEHVKSNVEELEDNLKAMAESDEELQEILDQYDERVQLYQQQRERFRQQYSDLTHDLEESRRALGLKQTEIGKFEAQKVQHERQLQQREDLVRGTAKQYGIRGFDFEITEKQITDFVETLAKMSRDSNKALERLRRETQEELEEVRNVLIGLNERKSGLNQRKDLSRSQIVKNDKQISIFQQKLDGIGIDEGGEAVLVEKKNEVERMLNKAKADYEAADLETKIRETDGQLRDLEQKKEALDAELVESTRRATDTAQIKYAQDKLKETNRRLETMIGAHGPRIKETLGSDWDPGSLESAFQEAIAQKSAAVKDAELKRDATVNKLDRINFKLTTMESERKQKLQDAREAEQIVQNAINADDISGFEEALKDLEEQYEMDSSDYSKIEANLDYMKACLKTANEDNKCRLCRRTLRDDKKEHFTRTEFFSRIEGIIERALKQRQEVQVENLLAQLEELRAAKPSYDLCLRLRDIDIPQLRSEITTLTLERDSVSGQLEDEDAVIRDLQSSKQDVESLSKTVQSIVQYHNETHELERKIHDLTETQKAAGMTRSPASVTDDLKKINDQTQTVKASLSRLQNDRERLRNQINSLELKIRDINAEWNRAQSQLKEKRDLMERIEETKSHNNEQRDNIRKFDEELQNIMPQIDQTRLKYEDTMNRNRHRVNELQNEDIRLSDSLRQLKNAEKEINDYIDQGGPQQLSRAHREIENLQGELERIEGEQRQVTIQVKKIEDNLRNTDDTKRSINDNLRYRRDTRRLETLQQEIAELETHNAEADRARYEEEGQQWEHQRNKLSTEKANLYGTLKTKDNQLQELLEEWETEYKDAAFKYREAHIKVETTKAAVEDLGRYGGALDKAIMKYHTLKMEEINRIIEELWKKTYQGTDIDTIMIRSDNETAKGNRSYNYRVVMVKQDADMDMRGRCSAGQRVLASIIIRLALAECFGVNCGLIALDEPTTNLDSNNIVALANSLAEIIKIRRKQANFQLIVITHDEEFLKNMQCAEFCDTYWRVTRNEKQKSTIERQSIHEVCIIQTCFLCLEEMMY